jgi:hypothetical protein
LNKEYIGWWGQHLFEFIISSVCSSCRRCAQLPKERSAGSSDAPWRQKSTNVWFGEESRSGGSKRRSLPFLRQYDYPLPLPSLSPFSFLLISSHRSLGLGTALVNALQSAGYLVRAVVRDASIEKTKLSFPGIEVVSSAPANLVDAFQGMDIVIEVMSNSLRPLGIKDFLDAAELTNVPIFVACGGAFALFVNEEKTLRLIDVVDGRENFLSMHEMHMAVQVHSPVTVHLLSPFLSCPFFPMVDSDLRRWHLKVRFPLSFRSALRTCHWIFNHSLVNTLLLLIMLLVSLKLDMKMLLLVLSQLWNNLKIITER